MHNPYRGEISTKIGDSNYILKLSIDRIIRLETEAKSGILKIAQNIADGDYGILDIERLVWYGLPEEAQRQIKREILPSLLYDGGIAYYATICADLLALSLQGKHYTEKKIELPNQ